MIVIEKEYTSGIVTDPLVWAGWAESVEVQAAPNRAMSARIHPVLQGTFTPLDIPEVEPGTLVDVRDRNGNPSQIEVYETPSSGLETTYYTEWWIHEAGAARLVVPRGLEAQGRNIGTAVVTVSGTSTLLGRFKAWASGIPSVTYTASADPVDVTLDLFVRDSAGLGTLYWVGNVRVTDPASTPELAEHNMSNGANTTLVPGVVRGRFYEVWITQTSGANKTFTADVWIHPRRMR